MLIYFHEKPLNKLPTTCASSAIFFPYIHAHVKKAEKIKKE